MTFRRGMAVVLALGLGAAAIYIAISAFTINDCVRLTGDAGSCGPVAPALSGATQGPWFVLIAMFVGITVSGLIVRLWRSNGSSL